MFKKVSSHTRITFSGHLWTHRTDQHDSLAEKYPTKSLKKSRIFALYLLYLTLLPDKTSKEAVRNSTGTCFKSLSTQVT